MHVLEWWSSWPNLTPLNFPTTHDNNTGRSPPSPIHPSHPRATNTNPHPHPRPIVMAAKGKKYTLKAQSGDGPKVCAFFSLPQGCRNAAKCPFIHDPNAAAPGEQPVAHPATPVAVTKNIEAMKQVKGR